MDVVGGSMRRGDVIVVEGYVANDRGHARLCAALSTHTLPQYLTKTPTPYRTPKGEDHDWDKG